MADSSIAISGQPNCYKSDSSTDPCGGQIVLSDNYPDGLNYCCGHGSAINYFKDGLNWYYSLDGVVDCGACELSI